MSIDALAAPLPRTQRYPIVSGTLRLNDDMGLLSTREPLMSDRESHIKRRKRMVETLRELSAPIVIEDFRGISGNCCDKAKNRYVKPTTGAAQPALAPDSPSLALRRAGEPHRSASLSEALV